MATKRRLLAVATIAALIGCCKVPKLLDDSPVETLPASSPGEQVFKMDFPCENNSDLRIRQIVLSPTETRIYLRYHNSRSSSVSVSTAPPGQADTFFLEAGDQHRHVQLRAATGISIGPKRQKLHVGDEVNFALIFPPIDVGWSPIDLHEGEIKKEGTTYWNFTDVPLKN
ncbi:MAG: hypothetical protein HY898_26740 [Deltaproteobacteria bacterium]|nr:hypothetical protein [Deltaproteobacteria bacterium]